MNMLDGLAKVVSAEVMVNKLRMHYLANAPTCVQLVKLDEMVRDAASLRSRAMRLIDLDDFTFTSTTVDRVAAAEVQKEIKKGKRITARRIEKAYRHILNHGIINDCERYFCDYEWSEKVEKMVEELASFALDFD